MLVSLFVVLLYRDELAAREEKFKAPEAEVEETSGAAANTDKMRRKRERVCAFFKSFCS